MKTVDRKYYITKRQLLQFITRDEEVISFGQYRRYTTESAQEVEFLQNILDTEKYPIFRECSEEEYNNAGPRPQTEHDRQAQILAAMAMSRGGTPIEVQDSENKPPVNPASTTSSPLTGGQNPAGMNVSQAETIAALRAKTSKDGKK